MQRGVVESVNARIIANKFCLSGDFIPYPITISGQLPSSRRLNSLCYHTTKLAKYS